VSITTAKSSRKPISFQQNWIGTVGMGFVGQQGILMLAKRSVNAATLLVVLHSVDGLVLYYCVDLTM
jgi:hypothetical protein